MKADPAARALYARVVADTNVLLSAALSPGGAPAALIDQLLQHARLVFSPATFAELETRIWLPKFDRYLPIEQRTHLLRGFNASAMWVDIPPEIALRKFSRDPQDDAFIHAAQTAGAMRLITGDDDLLSLHPVGEVHIITPRAALGELDTIFNKG